jgi:GNAT superfamily N-acetyltransferase
VATLSLRPVTEHDGELLRAIYASSREREFSQVPWSEEQKRQFLETQFCAQAQYYANYPNTTFSIILCDGLPAGRLYVARWEQEHRLIDIALLPEFRGQRIGMHFLQQLQAEAASVGKPLTLHVETFNPARQWYERHGFVLVEDKGVHLFYRWKSVKQ